MKKQIAVLTFVEHSLRLALSVEAQQPGQAIRLGILIATSKNCQADRSDDSAECVGAGESSDQVIVASGQ